MPIICSIKRDTEGTADGICKSSHLESRFWASEGNCIPSSKMCPRSLAISRFFTPEMREWKCLMHEKRCRQTGDTLCGYLLAFPFLSFRLFCFTLSQPFLELPLAFFTFVVGEDVRENTPGDVLDFVLRNTGIVDELLLAAQVGCSLRFDMKFLRCSCWWTDGLCWWHVSLLKKRKMQALVKPIAWWASAFCFLVL